ncbi:putative signal transducing protein [Alteromonadaceae bacterium 2753L.S.0a.02]|nr:putative signal transducing protein [Alteromonadaceae bacterium 2753L.S.0a.02]
MKLIYSHSNKILVENVKNLLQQEIIPVVLKNEYAGGAVGELAAIDTWPEIWVQEHNYNRALAVLNKFLSQRDEDEWQCSTCGELNGSAFEACWQCGTGRKF